MGYQIEDVVGFTENMAVGSELTFLGMSAKIAKIELIITLEPSDSSDKQFDGITMTLPLDDFNNPFLGRK